jgi:hypothetical protein
MSAVPHEEEITFRKRIRMFIPTKPYQSVSESGVHHGFSFCQKSNSKGML